MHADAGPPPLLEQLLRSLAPDAEGAYHLPAVALQQFAAAARASDGPELLGLLDAGVHAAGVLAQRKDGEPAARDLLTLLASLAGDVHERAAQTGEVLHERTEDARRQAQRQAAAPRTPGLPLPAPKRKKAP
jgi:hypothetical protein